MLTWINLCVWFGAVYGSRKINKEKILCGDSSEGKKKRDTETYINSIMYRKKDGMIMFILPFLKWNMELICKFFSFFFFLCFSNFQVSDEAWIYEIYFFWRSKVFVVLSISLLPTFSLFCVSFLPILWEFEFGAVLSKNLYTLWIQWKLMNFCSSMGFDWLIFSKFTWFFVL